MSCVIREKLKLLTDIHDFTTLFRVIFEMQVPWKILRLKTSNVTSNTHHMIHHKVIRCANSRACMPIMDRMSTPIVFYFFTFVVRENEILISVIRDSLFSLFMNRATDPHVRPSFMIVWDTFCIGGAMTCDL